MFKIIETHACKTCDELLILMDRNSNGEDFVRLVAWHQTEDGFFIQEAEVDVCNSNDDFTMMRRYILDFSEASANEFVNSIVFE
jgi:hypothetical protein